MYRGKMESGFQEDVLQNCYQRNLFRVLVFSLQRNYLCFDNCFCGIHRNIFNVSHRTNLS